MISTVAAGWFPDTNRAHVLRWSAEVLEALEAHQVEIVGCRVEPAVEEFRASSSMLPVEDAR